MHTTTILKAFVLILIGVFFTGISYSQENYLPGYIIDSEGKTVNGFIDHRDWKLNPDQVSFKEEIDKALTIYKPGEINEFGVQDEIYVSAIVDIETSPYKIESLKEDPALHLRAVTVFLQTLYKGDKSLYLYVDPTEKENFYILQDGVYKLLINKKYLIRTEKNGRRIVENDRYKSQLAYYLNECLPIQSKLEKASYNQKGLTGAFDFYYTCTGSEFVFQKKVEKISKEIGIIAGASNFSLKFRSDDFDYLADADFSRSTNFTTGIFLDLVLPRNHGKWSIYNELLYSSFNVNGRHMNFENENKYTITDSEFQYSYLKLNNLVRFKYPVGRNYIFFNGGFSNGFAIKNNNNRRTESKFYSDERTEVEPALNRNRIYEQGIIIGSGAKIANFSFELRYERGTGMSDYAGLNSTTQRYFLLCGYRF